MLAAVLLAPKPDPRLAITLDSTPPTLELEPLLATWGGSSFAVRGRVSKRAATATVNGNAVRLAEGLFEAPLTLKPEETEVTATDAVGSVESCTLKSNAKGSWRVMKGSVLNRSGNTEE